MTLNVQNVHRWLTHIPAVTGMCVSQRWTLLSIDNSTVNGFLR